MIIKTFMHYTSGDTQDQLMSRCLSRVNRTTVSLAVICQDFGASQK